MVGVIRQRVPRWIVLGCLVYCQQGLAGVFWKNTYRPRTHPTKTSPSKDSPRQWKLMIGETPFFWWKFEVFCNLVELSSVIRVDSAIVLRIRTIGLGTSPGGTPKCADTAIKPGMIYSFNNRQTGARARLHEKELDLGHERAGHCSIINSIKVYMMELFKYLQVRPSRKSHETGTDPGFSDRGGTNCYVHPARSTSRLKSKARLARGGPWQLWGNRFKCSLTLSELYFEGLWCKTGLENTIDQNVEGAPVAPSPRSPMHWQNAIVRDYKVHGTWISRISYGVYTWKFQGLPGAYTGRYVENFERFQFCHVDPVTATK